MPNYVPQRTLQYSTFIKRGIKEALQAAFANHPEPRVATAKVELDFEHGRWQMPGIIIKFYERRLPNAGVGHVEYLPSPQNIDPTNPTLFVKYFHRKYYGDVSFEIYGQSAVDRDLVRDAFVEVIAMNDATAGGQAFLDRFYYSMPNTPYGLWHFPVLMWDDITGYGEQVITAPWMIKDTLVYRVDYRVPIYGEFYSNTPELPASTGLLEQVDVYPWIPDIDPTPDDNPDEPGNPGWYRFTGWSDTNEWI